MSNNSKLRSMARELPYYPHATRRTWLHLSGADLLAEDPEAKADGKPVESKGRYRRLVPVAADHFKNLQAAWQLGGASRDRGLCKARSRVPYSHAGQAAEERISTLNPTKS
jgi:hypothetical protein